jgi:hypothetical protein
MTSYFVAPNGTGDTFTTDAPGLLNSAIDMAEAGDEIVLKNGVYRQLVRFKRSGKPGMPILLRGENPQQAIIEMPGGVPEGKGAGNNSVINTKPYSYLTIRDLTINGRKWGESGITADDGRNIIIEYNRIWNTGSGGISMKSAENNIVRFNLIENLGNSFLGEGLYVGQVTGNYPVKNTEIYGNTIRRACMNFIDLKIGNENVNVHHNIFEDLLPGRDRPDLGAGLSSDGLVVIGASNGAESRFTDNIIRNVVRDRPAQVFKVSENSGHIVQRNVAYNIRNQRAISGHQKGTVGQSVVSLNTFSRLASLAVNNRAGSITGTIIMDNRMDASEFDAYAEEQRILTETVAIAVQQYQNDGNGLSRRSPTLLFV